MYRLACSRPLVYCVRREGASKRNKTRGDISHGIPRAWNKLCIERSPQSPLRKVVLYHLFSVLNFYSHVCVLMETLNK